MPLAYRTVLINLFFRPKKAFKTIYAYGLYKYTWPFFLIIGINSRINKELYTLADSRNDIFFKLPGDIIFGALLGWIGLWIFSMFIAFTGRWLLKGRADSDELFNILSYIAVVSAVILVSTVVCLYLLRHAGYTDEKYPHNWSNIFYCIDRVHYYLTEAGAFYSFILIVIGVSVAQGFTTINGFFNVVLPMVIGVVAVGLSMRMGEFFFYLGSH